MELLFTAVGETEELLGALINPESLNTPQTISLRVFISVLRALLTSFLPVTEKTEWTNTMSLKQTLVGIPKTELKMISSRNANNSKGTIETIKRIQHILQFCGDSICNLIQDELVPMRYVHIADQFFYFSYYGFCNFHLLLNFLFCVFYPFFCHLHHDKNICNPNIVFLHVQTSK